MRRRMLVTQSKGHCVSVTYGNCSHTPRKKHQTTSATTYSYQDLTSTQTGALAHFLFSVPTAVSISLDCIGVSWMLSQIAMFYLHYIGAICSRHKVKGQTELPGKVEAFLGHLHIRWGQKKKWSVRHHCGLNANICPSGRTDGDQSLI